MNNLEQLCQLQISLAFSGLESQGQLRGAQGAAGGAGSQDLRKGARQGKEYHVEQYVR